MGLPKGQTNNRAGRPKGTPNKVTADMRGWINEVLSNNRAQFESDLKNLEPQQRVAMFEKLLAYSVPKLQSIEQKIDYGNLSDEQLDVIINQLNNEL